MLGDPQSISWGMSDLKRDLKAKLGVAYKSCMSAILDMDVVMREIASNIDKLDGSDQVRHLPCMAPNPLT